MELNKGMGTLDNHCRTAHWVSDTSSTLTPSKREDRWDNVMEDFEKQLDQIAKEYRKSLEDYDYNNELTLELEKSRATIEQLNQLVARERKTSEELKRKAKVAEVTGQVPTQKRQETLVHDQLRELLFEKIQLLSTSEEQGYETAKGDFQKEIADLKKQLKQNDDLLTAKSLGCEGQAQNFTGKLGETLGQNFARMNKSPQAMNAEIQSLKQKQGGLEVNTRTNNPEKTEQLYQTIEELKFQVKKKEADLLLSIQQIKDLSTKLHEKTKQNERQLVLLREKDQILAISEYGYGKARGDFEKEIADLKKQLEEKDGGEIESLKMENKQPGGATKMSASSNNASHSLPLKTVKLHQYYNSFIRDHFYTTDWTKLGVGKGKNGYNYKGVVGYVFHSPVEGAFPLHRYWNERRGQHLYTTGWSDESDLNKTGYVYETISCYVFRSFMDGMRPLVRYYNFNSGDHFLTTDLKEFGQGKYGFIKDRVLGYVL